VVIIARMERPSEADAILKSALDRVGVPLERRADFDGSDRGDYLRVTLPDGDVIELDIEERALNEGGYVTALVRELENRGFRKLA